MREFAITANYSTVAGATTLISLVAASAPNPQIEFLRWWCGQAANATSAQQHIQIVTQLSSWPTVTGQVPKKLKPSDPNASVIATFVSNAQGNCGINATAEGAGTKSIVIDDSFNVLNGFLHVPTPAETLVLPAAPAVATGTGLAGQMFFPSAPGTLTGWSWGTIYREV